MMANIKMHSLFVIVGLTAVTEIVRGGEQNATVVISSTGGVAQHGGELLGQYEYDEDKECFVQTSTEQNNDQYTARYLYKDKDDDWVVSSKLGGSLIWLWNINSNTENLTNGAWMYNDGGTWQNDLSLTITPGPLPPLPNHFIVTASGAFTELSNSLEYLGVFNKTDRWWAGRPVYANTKGQFLYHGIKSWMIAELGYYTLRGSQSYPSPVSVKSWTYLEETTNYGGYNYFSSRSSKVEKPASVTVLEATQPNLVRYKEDRKRILYQHNLKKNQYDHVGYSYDNSGIIIAVIGAVVAKVVIICVIRCVCKGSKSKEATRPSQPPQNVVPMNQVENASEQTEPQPQNLIQSLKPGQDQMDRAMAPTPYSVNQSWNTGRGQPTPYSIQ